MSVCLNFIFEVKNFVNRNFICKFWSEKYPGLNCIRIRKTLRKFWIEILNQRSSAQNKIFILFLSCFRHFHFLFLFSQLTGSSNLTTGLDIPLTLAVITRYRYSIFTFSLYSSVVGPDPVGSASFCRIRIGIGIRRSADPESDPDLYPFNQM
jgi:hypothetical protein